MRKRKSVAYSIVLMILILAVCSCGGDEKSGDVLPNDGGASPDQGGDSPNDGGATPNNGVALPEDYLKADNNPPANYSYEIVNTFSHDKDAFTQGLVFENRVFYESTGLYGRSDLRKVEPATGAVLQFVHVPDQYFGEGIAVFGDKIIQLTWKSRTGFVYGRDNFEVTRKFEYAGEGWGITHDGKRLIMSDGSSSLRFLDPETLGQIGSIDVYDNKGPVVRLNELEFVRGEVFANVWQTNRIARIDPDTGRVTGWINLEGLLSPEEAQKADVLNGIAYDREGDRLFVTGKLWPKLFEIRLLEAKTDG